MEFGLFIQGFCPGKKAHDPREEHAAFMNEVDLCVHADRNNWKYVWVTEHHALTEYSHVSASDVFLGYLARATERLHLGSGIFNLSPRVNHPVRNAERAAMLDQLTRGRFEFGTGRGAGSHEVGTFNIHDTSSTKAEWDEVAPEILRMWKTTEYTFQGKSFAVDKPHNVLPKPYGPSHPPIWVACGNPPTFSKAGSLGIGALGFNFSPIGDMKPLIDAYKDAVGKCTRPLGDYVNDNVMITNAVVCLKDRDRARAAAMRPDRGYLFSLVCLYHDTFPKPAGAPVWPEKPTVLDKDMVARAIEVGALLCGTPDEVCEQLRHYERTGVDQLVFGFPNNLTREEALETIELFGREVIPQFDRDRVHRTKRFRDTVLAR
jgi:alkanesulfonate monooxygenase SsuD/methylene tetrahydromethanopterin reductase-like flavin-dependent oxidoreductase (luciferase family)